MKRFLYAALLLFLVLHNDFWWWDDASFLFGLPIGLTYHLLYCLALSLLFWLLVRWAWPADLDSQETQQKPQKGGPRQ